MVALLRPEDTLLETKQPWPLVWGLPAGDGDRGAAGGEGTGRVLWAGDPVLEESPLPWVSPSESFMEGNLVFSLCFAK